MPRYNGHDGSVKIGGTAVARVNTWQLDEETDVLSGYGMGETFEESHATVNRWSGNFQVDYHHNDAATGGITIKSEITLELLPAEDVAPNESWTGTAIVTAIGNAASKSDFHKTTISFKGTGALVKAAISA
ncbi:MAG: hypothetical protein AAF899_17950 [Pseudomonadota bacterium]